jgi:hypothetical protein
MSSGPENIAQKIKPVLELPDEEAYLLLASLYKEFLSNINNNPCFDEFKASARFLSLLTQVCLANQLTYEERVYCNAMIYKQINKANDTLKVILINLGLVANRKMVQAFIDCGLDRTMSSFLAVARKSSFQKKDCISRMNFAILCTSDELMTTKRITDIYCASCSSIEDVYMLFIYTLKDSFIYDKNNGADWIEKSHLIIADRMNSAILSILESLNKDDLSSILEAYYLYEVLEKNIDEEDIRISFKNINSNVFPNIASVVSRLAKEKNIYLP